MSDFWRRVGGRKTFNGWLAFAALTVMAFPLQASFAAYSAAVLVALGITNGLTATEDVLRERRQRG